MSGYLEEYGAGEEQKENLIRNSILIAVGVVVLALLAFYLFRPFHQIRVVKHFLSEVRDKNYPSAYAAWGCTTAHPCSEYPYPKFLEDWGPQSAAAANPVLKITDAEGCGTAVIVSVATGAGQSQKLYVERASDGISYSPLPHCPGKSAWAIMIHRTLGRVRTVFF